MAKKLMKAQTGTTVKPTGGPTAPISRLQRRMEKKAYVSSEKAKRAATKDSILTTKKDNRAVRASTVIGSVGSGRGPKSISSSTSFSNTDNSNSGNSSAGGGMGGDGGRSGSFSTSGSSSDASKKKNVGNTDIKIKSKNKSKINQDTRINQNQNSGNDYKKGGAIKKYQTGGKTVKPTKKIQSSSDRVKGYEKSGWKKDNPGAIKQGYAEPKDTVGRQYMSKDKMLVGINTKKTGGATKKYATGGVVKNKTLNPAGAGLMKKGGSTKKK